MPLNIKQLIAVLIVASVVFRLAKRIVLRFCAEADYRRRRNCWLMVTLAAFISPNFWIFTCVAVLAYVTFGRKDTNPAAFYLMLLSVVPPLSATIPMIGISHLFAVDNNLLLSFFVLVPAAIRLRGREENRKFAGLDLLIMAYGLCQSFFFLHALNSDGSDIVPLTGTEALRRSFLFFFSSYVPYFVISRTNASRTVIVDTLASYCLSSALLGGIALFESAKHWLLYGDLALRWGLPVPFLVYLQRGNSIRAMASAGHPLALGYLLAVALGFWLYLRKYVESRVTRAAIGVFWIASLLAPYSRGPWIVAAVIPTVAACFSPKPFSRVVRLMAFGLAGLLLIVASPAGDRITSVLPFFGGTVDTFNIDYRQRLLQRSFEIIRASPFFGDPRALLKMHDLRQGQGIIDIVNTYIEVLLNSGVVGLFLLLAFAFVGIRRAWLSRARVAPHDSDLGLLGGAILSCTAGTLVMMADGSFGTALEYMYFALIGLLSAYAVVARRSLFMNSQFDSSPNESRLMLTARRGQ